MKITQEEVVDRQTILHIELEEEDLSPYLERGFRKVAQRASIPGFRPGKAPRPIVERYLGRESLLGESLEYMLSHATELAIAEQSLEPAGTPSIELLGLKPVTMKATVALTPQVNILGYRDIRLEEPDVEVTEDEISESFDKMRREAGSWDPVERAVASGDMVTMDVVATVEGRTILDEKDSVYVAGEDREEPFPGFAQGLVAAEVGNPKKFDVPIAEDYSEPDLAGKEVHVVMNVADVKELVLPEIDDEFAKGVRDGYESLAELRRTVKEGLSASRKSVQQSEYRSALLDELLKVATIELPPLLIDREVESIASRQDRLVESLRIGFDDYLRMMGTTLEEYREKIREEAVRHLNGSYALSTLAEIEGLSISEEEIDDKIHSIAASDGEEGEALKPQDVDSEAMRAAVRRGLLATKAMERLIAVAGGKPAELEKDGQTSDIKDQESEEGGETIDDKS